jgi:hypothetical protein
LGFIGRAICWSKGKPEIVEHAKQITLPFDQHPELEFADTFINHIDSPELLAPELSRTALKCKTF